MKVGGVDGIARYERAAKHRDVREPDFGQHECGIPRGEFKADVARDRDDAVQCEDARPMPVGDLMERDGVVDPWIAIEDYRREPVLCIHVTAEPWEPRLPPQHSSELAPGSATGAAHAAPEA
jgi:hypothetical protein